MADAVTRRSAASAGGGATMRRQAAAFALWANQFRPAPTVAVGVETHLGVPHSMILCMDAPCLAHAGGWPGDDVIPFRQSELDDLARYENKPVSCDRCGRALTAIVNGPDPRD
jgi:hypothetical protein